jgi:hypothetical protein
MRKKNEENRSGRMSINGEEKCERIEGERKPAWCKKYAAKT